MNLFMFKGTSANNGKRYNNKIDRSTLHLSAVKRIFSSLDDESSSSSRTSFDDDSEVVSKNNHALDLFQILRCDTGAKIQTYDDDQLYHFINNLLEKDPNIVDAVDNHGHSPLQVLCSNPGLASNKRIINLLVDTSNQIWYDSTDEIFLSVSSKTSNIAEFEIAKNGEFRNLKEEDASQNMIERNMDNTVLRQISVNRYASDPLLEVYSATVHRKGVHDQRRSKGNLLKIIPSMYFRRDKYHNKAEENDFGVKKRNSHISSRLKIVLDSVWSGILSTCLLHNPIFLKKNRNVDSRAAEVLELPLAPVPAKAVRHRSYSGSAALHRLCQNASKTTPHIVDYLIRCNPTAVCLKDSLYQNLPIHEVCIACTSLPIHIDILLLLLQQWPMSCQIKNVDGNLPMHLATRVKDDRRREAKEDIHSRLLSDMEDFSAFGVIHGRQQQEIYRAGLERQKSLSNGLRSQPIRSRSIRSLKSFKNLDCSADFSPTSVIPVLSTHLLENPATKIIDAITREISCDESSNVLKDAEMKPNQEVSQLTMIKTLVEYWPHSLYVTNNNGHTPIQVALITMAACGQSHSPIVDLLYECMAKYPEAELASDSNQLSRTARQLTKCDANDQKSVNDDIDEFSRKYFVLKQLPTTTPPMNLSLNRNTSSRERICTTISTDPTNILHNSLSGESTVNM